MKMACGALVVVQLSLCALDAQRPPGTTQTLRLLPKDEAIEDAKLVAFRAELIRAVARHDVGGVIGVVEPGWWARQGGIESFRATLNAPTDLWNILHYVLTHGGAFTTIRGKVIGRREFCAPYIYGAYPKLPDAALDPTFPWAITGADIPVRSAPTISAPVIRRLSFDLVQADGYFGDGNWAKVTLGDGREGYVAKADIRDPSDYHACFAQLGGRWLLVELERDVQPRRDQ